jgi:hypothetical protein
MNLFPTAILSTALLLAGCAQQPRSPELSSDARRPVRGREAAEVIPVFLGHYAVTDARRNRREIASAELLLEAGVPTLRLRGRDGQVAVQIEANECSGDLSNKFSKNMYLACFGPDRPPRRYFTVAKVPSDHVHKSGALIPLYDPMPVSGGYLIEYQPGEYRSNAYPLAARRTDP